MSKPANIKLKISTILKVYIFLNIYKALLGIIVPKAIITGLSLVLLLGVFFFILIKELRPSSKVGFIDCFIYLLLLVLFGHLFYSAFFGESTMFIATFSAFMQLTTPLVVIYIIRKLPVFITNNLASFLVKIISPMIVVGFIEFLLPIGLRTRIYTFYSLITSGSADLDVAYYLGDTSFGGLRLGSLFFEPLTFGFVSSFYVVFLVSKHYKRWFFPLFVNLMTLGKLPVFSTIISFGSKFLRPLSLFYYITAGLVVLAYFVINAQNILLNNPSMANHIIGLAAGIGNGLEKPLLGHGLGTSGYLIYMIYAKADVIGPFYRETEFMNGNESGVGVLFYQLGAILTCMYVFFIIRIFFEVHKKHSRIMAGCVFAYLISLFLSESILGVTVVSTLFIFSYATFPRKN